jgi:reactive intermediate/imine deaminase
MTEHIAPAGVAPGFGYSHVVVATGRLVVVSGQVALDESGQIVGPGDALAQARQVFENLRRCLAAADATFADVVKFTVYVTDLATITAVRAVRDEYIDTARPPASSAVQVAGLVLPDLLLEIDALAVS